MRNLTMFRNTLIAATLIPSTAWACDFEMSPALIGIWLLSGAAPFAFVGGTVIWANRAEWAIRPLAPLLAHWFLAAAGLLLGFEIVSHLPRAWGAEFAVICSTAMVLQTAHIMWLHMHRPSSPDAQ